MCCFVFRFNVRLVNEHGQRVETCTCCPATCWGTLGSSVPEGLVDQAWPLHLLHRFHFKSHTWRTTRDVSKMESYLCHSATLCTRKGWGKRWRRWWQWPQFHFWASSHFSDASPRLGSVSKHRNCRCHPSPFAFRVLTQVCEQTYGAVTRLEATAYWTGV